MRSPRLTLIFVVLCLVFAAGTLVLPLEVLEVLGMPLVIAAAYFGGRRAGITVALWATLVATVAFLVVRHADVEDYVVTVAGYLVIGVLVGLGVDRLQEQTVRLEEALLGAELARRQVAASEARYRTLFERSLDAITVHGVDTEGQLTPFTSVNDGACVLLGYTRAELLALTPRAVDAAAQPGLLRRMTDELLRSGSVVYESVYRSREGERIPVEVSATLTEMEAGPVILSVARDISLRKEAERRLEELSLRDELTGLFNRRGFNVLLPELVKRARRSGRPAVVLYADVDAFKRFNDEHGHAVGDDVLRAVARALQGTFRETDLVARLGGDEFCVVAEAEDLVDPAAFGARLEEAVAWAAAPLGVAVGLSHGEVVADWHALEDPADLLRRVDELMYAGKRARPA